MAPAGGEADRLVELEPLVRAISRDFYVAGYDRDDLEQEARIAALEAVRAHDGRRPLEILARVCIRRRLVELLSMSRRLKRGAGARELELDEQAAVRSTLELVLERYEVRAVLEAMLGLSDLERQAVAAVAAGYGYDELGPRKMIDNAVQRGRSRLRQDLAA